jgi:predicted kinase
MKKENNNPKILECIICIGVPASGKSTWSKEYVRKNSDYVRIGRDEYRFMLKDAPVCDPKVEKMISKMVFSDIDHALAAKFNIIVDNTHVKREYIYELVNYVETRCAIKYRMFDISLQEAIERDKNRERMVGEGVIRKMYADFRSLKDTWNFVDTSHPKKHIYQPPKWKANLPFIVVSDLDGTLAHMSGKRGPFDWEKCDLDEPDLVLIDMLKRHKAYGDTVWLISGRLETARKPTEEWLEFYGVEYDRLIMRPMQHEFMKDSLLKQQIYKTEILDKYNVLVFYDDRNQVVDMYRQLGQKVFQVEPGNF